MTDTNTRSNGDFGIDGNVVADQTLGFGGTIAFGVADEAFTGVAQSAAAKAATTAVGIGFTVAMVLLHQSVEGFRCESSVIAVRDAQLGRHEVQDQELVILQ